MIEDGDDLAWTRLTKPWERLAWARARRFKSQSEFARRAKVNVNTYAAHERAPGGPSKHIDLNAERAAAWADILRVRWEWLLLGKGVPWLEDSEQRKARPAARAAELIESQPAEEQERILRVIEAIVSGRAA